MLAHAVCYLRVEELAAVATSARQLREQCDLDVLWRDLYTRRQFGGLSVVDLPESVVKLSWKTRYRAAAKAVWEREPLPIQRLRQLVPGFRGRLACLVVADDEATRLSTLHVLANREPLVADDAESAIACVRQVRTLFHETSEHDLAWPDSLFGPTVVPLDNCRANVDLDARLERLRALGKQRPGATCRPLLDGLRCIRGIAGLDEERVQAALRVVVGATALCSTLCEAEAVALSAQCDVACCSDSGVRLVEYNPCVFPQLQWSEPFREPQALGMRG